MIGARCGFVVMALLAVAACNRNDDRVAFDGIQFRTESDAIGNDLRNFSLSVTPASASLDGAREAGRYEGTRYCIENYGTSRIRWSIGPDSDPAALRILNDTLTLQGRCTPL